MDRHWFYDLEEPSGNLAAADQDRWFGCEGEFCDDQTCRICRYRGDGGHRWS
jgi:hypothetical protein